MTDLENVLNNIDTASESDWLEYRQILHRFGDDKPAKDDEERLGDLMQTLQLDAEKVRSDLAALEESRDLQATLEDASDIDAEQAKAMKASDEANKYEAKVVPEIQAATAEARARAETAREGQRQMGRARKRLLALQAQHPHLFQCEQDAQEDALYGETLADAATA